MTFILDMCWRNTEFLPIEFQCINFESESYVWGTSTLVVCLSSEFFIHVMLNFIQLLPDPLPMLCSIQFSNRSVRRALKFTWRKKRTCVPLCCFIPQMSTTSGSHLVKAWSQELSPGLLHQWQEPNCWNHHLLPPKVHSNRNWDREQSQGCT